MMLIVEAAKKTDPLDAMLLSLGKTLDVVKLKKPSLIAASSLFIHKGTTVTITLNYCSFDCSRNMP